jgi:hypothetical protein
MHGVIERFIGRYEVWRRSAPLRNPLNIPALVLATSIAQALYQIATSHSMAWRAVVLLGVDIVFLVLYVRRSPSAWLVLPVWGIMALIQLPFAVVSSVHRYPLHVSGVIACLLLVIGVGFIAWGFAIRRRYYACVGYVPEHSHQHLTNRRANGPLSK